MMDYTDPVSEVRLVREAHAAAHGYDLDRIVEDIRRGEQKLISEGWQLVTRKKISNEITEVIPVSHIAPRT